MKLQVTLALLCMAFCFSVTTTTEIKSCYVNAGSLFSTDKGHVKLCSDYAKSCIAYIDKYTNQFVRDCSKLPKENACTSIAKANEKTCYSCDSAENCNDKPFELKCHLYTGYSRSEFGYPFTCPSGTCIMYKKDNSYIRGCATTERDCKTLIAGGANLCTECNSEKCNKVPFISCNEYNGMDATQQGTPKLCPSGICIMYKDINDNYIRGCAINKDECRNLKTVKSAAFCSQCDTNECNNGKFISCYEGSAVDPFQLGNLAICPSGTCIMYKKDHKYIRGCATTEGDCKTLTAKGANFCTQCNSEKCNKEAFVSVISCNEYRGRDTTQLGTPKLCPSGTCIMYKDGYNYIRSCATTKESCKTLYNVGATSCSECNANGCNNNAFVIDISCFEINTFDASQLGILLPCQSGKCIMYKDTKSCKYVRSCASDRKNCLAIKETATQCSECTTDICNKLRFNTGPTVGLRSLSQAP